MHVTACDLCHVMGILYEPLCVLSVDGGELFDRIIDENYTLTELDSVIFIRQICEGLRHMHKMYILHLDLKARFVSLEMYSMLK